MKKQTIAVKVQQIPLDDFDSEVFDDFQTAYDTEVLIFRLKDYREVSVIILRYLGYKYKEIIKILNLKNDTDYYKLWRSLRKNAKELLENDKK